MRFRVWLLSFVPWRRFCGRVCGWITQRSPDLGYFFGWHVGLAASMAAWALNEHRWPAYHALRDEAKRHGYKLPESA